MTKEEREYYITGAYARRSGYPKSDCPGENKHWYAGYDDYRTMTSKQIDEILNEKGV